MNRYFRFLLVFGAVAAMAGCRDFSKYDTPDFALESNNKGVLKIVADKSLQSIMNQHIRIFENKFPEAHIQVTYLSESDVMKQFIDTSNCVAILERRLTPEEYRILEHVHGIKPKEHIMAKDAVVLITSKQSKDTLIDMAQLKALFTGGSRPLVFEGKNSGVASYIMKEANAGKSNNLYALNSLEEVIAYVKEHPGAIGFIPFATVSDPQNEVMNTRLTNVCNIYFRVQKNGETLAVPANQSTIATGDYPLIRPVNYVIGNYKSKLGTGFVNFLFKQKASRIFLKEGLVPTIFAERLISIDTGNLEK
jgi:phosphate transport system substrate-binding protein